MSCTYEVQERDGHILDVMTDDALGLRMVVSRQGAELVSLAKRNAQGEWIGFLYRDADVTEPASGWKNHATVMGYYIHRLKNEKTNYYGHEIKGGNHGFVRNKLFAAPKVSEESGMLKYSVPYQEINALDYPFKVSMDLTYRIHGEKLFVQFYFTNNEMQRAAHLSFGLHPGFAVSSIDQAQILFPGGSFVRYAAPDNFLSGDKQFIEIPKGEFPFSKSELPKSFILEFKKVSIPHVVLVDAPSKRRIEIDLQGVPYFTLWSDGGPFICVEPHWGLPDHHLQRPFENKEGIQVIAPRGNLNKIFAITPSFI